VLQNLKFEEEEELKKEMEELKETVNVSFDELNERINETFTHLNQRFDAFEVSVYLHTHTSFLSTQYRGKNNCPQVGAATLSFSKRYTPAV